MTAATTTEQGISSSSPPRILLVDDNPNNLQVLYQTLEGQGYELLAAPNGDLALKIAHQAVPDLILLDIQMPPGIDGYEVCRRLKANETMREIPVIFLSALNQTTDKVEGFNAGGVDYISKPFQADEVIARVRTHLTIHHLKADLAQRNKALHDANLKMTRDLLAAEQVQEALLPQQMPNVPGVEFAWAYEPCDELAGDGLNIIPLDDQRVAIYVFDVTGHGVQAALLSVAVTHSIISPYMTDRAVPVAVAERLNRSFPMSDRNTQFVTMIYGVLDLVTRRFTYISAGHPQPIIRQANGQTRLGELTGFPIGVTDRPEYNDVTVQLEPGDQLYLYSDGLLEERNAAGKQFGIDRAIAAITDHSQEATLQQTVSALSKQLKEWNGGRHLTDDLSILGVKIKQV